MGLMRSLVNWLKSKPEPTQPSVVSWNDYDWHCATCGRRHKDHPGEVWPIETWCMDCWEKHNAEVVAKAEWHERAERDRLLAKWPLDAA